MNESDEKLNDLVKRSLGPVADTELKRDLWPRIEARLEAPAARTALRTVCGAPAECRRRMTPSSGSKSMPQLATSCIVRGAGFFSSAVS